MDAGRRTAGGRLMPGPAALLDVARRELGTLEEPPGSNVTKYGRWYGLQAAWCAMFVSWCAEQSGNGDVIPRHAYTPTGAAYFQQRGRWGSVPNVGALVYYDVSGMGRISHVGIVESVNADGSWVAIEGNTNAAGSRTGGGVRRLRRTTVGTHRGGFGYPQYAAQSAAPALSVGWPTIRRGSTGDAVRALQEALNRWLTAQRRRPLTVDGDFGTNTRAAVVAFQLDRGLDADGIVGPLTWRAVR